MQRRRVVRYLGASLLCPLCLRSGTALAEEKRAADSGHGEAGKEAAKADAHGADGETRAAGKAEGEKTGKPAPDAKGAGDKHEGPHWGYEGEGGPEHWAELSEDFRICGTGREQSPIDLSEPTPALLKDIAPVWKKSPYAIVNNGHTIQVNVPPASFVNYGGKDYQLLQFHFHHPSEHTVDGKAHEMEVHFVHKAEDGGLTVLGIFIKPGAEHPVLVPIWARMPEEAGGTVKVEDEFIELAKFLPRNMTTVQYAGSLTTPPCGEVVNWVVFRDHIEASKTQIEQFAKLYPMNARPVQPRFRRAVLLDFF